MRLESWLQTRIYQSSIFDPVEERSRLLWLSLMSSQLVPQTTQNLIFPSLVGSEVCSMKPMSKRSQYVVLKKISSRLGAHCSEKLMLWWNKRNYTVIQLQQNVLCGLPELITLCSLFIKVFCCDADYVKSSIITFESNDVPPSSLVARLPSLFNVACLSAGNIEKLGIGPGNEAVPPPPQD